MSAEFFSGTEDALRLGYSFLFAILYLFLFKESAVVVETVKFDLKAVL